MNNEKGFIQIILLIVILGAVIVASLEWAEEEKIAQQLGKLAGDFQQSSEQQIKTVTETVTIDRSGVICQDGKKTVNIDGVVYYLGTIKNTWGDLAPVDCE